MITKEDLKKIRTALEYFCSNKSDFVDSEFNKYVETINKIKDLQKE
jgi:hypothetical protein